MSIQRKLLILTLCVFTLAVFFAALHGYRNSQQQVDTLFDSDLQAMASFIAQNQPATFTTSTLSEDEYTAQKQMTVIDVDIVFQVIQQGHVIKRSAAAPIEPIFKDPHKRTGFYDAVFFAERWHTYSLAVADQYTVVVAQPSEYRLSSTESILLTTIAPILYAMPIIALLLFYVIRTSLKPLVILSREITHKGSDDLSEIDISAPPKELQPVVTRLNSLLQRLSLAFERERTLSANAAHELRTPVSVLRLSAHNLREANQKRALDEQQFNELDANVNRMAHVIEQIIALYRYSPEHFSEQMQSVAIDHIVRETIASNYDLIAEKRQDISLDAVEAKILGEPFALQIMFENVLKNAIKYSGEASQIRVVITQKLNKVLVTFEDSGHVDPDDIARLTESFYRAKQASSSGAKGSGLGLSIVQYICNIHQGELTLSVSELGGLKVHFAFEVLPKKYDKANGVR